MEIIRGILSILMVASLLFLIVGLIKPQWVLRWTKKPTRWKVAGWWFLIFFVFALMNGFVSEKVNPTKELKDLTSEELNKMLNLIDRERDLPETDILDSVEFADRERKSLRPARNDNTYSKGWLYKWIRLYEGDFPPPFSKENYMLCRIRLGDFKTETLFTSEYNLDLVSVDNNQLFFRNSNALFKQSIYSNERVILKEVESNTKNDINNVIVFNNRLYYTQPIDSIADDSRAAYNICSMNTDGSEDRKLTGRYYQDFCIYKGMIFARNIFSQELEQLDINGNQIDNYGKIGYEYFDVYNDCIYYLDGRHMLYKINIVTKNKQLLNNNTFTKLNIVISRNYLFFNTSNAQIGRHYGYGIMYGNLCCINLENGKMNEMYKEQLCILTDVYNGIIYCKEFIESDSIQGKGNVVEFQMNIDGTDKKNLKN